MWDDVQLEKALGETERRPVSTIWEGVQLEGDWKPNTVMIRHGRAIKLYDEGNTFEGYYFNDKKCGKGRRISTSGEVYEGQFEDGKPNGFGKWQAYSPCFDKILEP